MPTCKSSPTSRHRRLRPRNLNKRARAAAMKWGNAGNDGVWWPSAKTRKIKRIEISRNFSTRFGNMGIQSSVSNPRFKVPFVWAVSFEQDSHLTEQLNFYGRGTITS